MRPRRPARRRRLLLAVLLFMAVAVVSDLASAQPAGTADNPAGVDDGSGCEDLPGAATDACEVSGQIEVPIETSVSLPNPLAAAARTLWLYLVSLLAQGLQWLLDALLALATRTTRIDVGADWFAGEYFRMTKVGLAFTLPLLLVAMVRSLFHDRSEMLRAVFVWLPVAMLGMFAARAVVQTLVVVTDELAAVYQDGLGASVGDFVRTMGLAVTPYGEGLTQATGPALPSLGAVTVFAVTALFMGFATFVLWVELLLREAAVYVVVLFMPLGFAAMVWAPTRHWLRRMAEGLAALLLSKFVIVVILGMAAAALNAIADDALEGTIAGQTGVPPAAPTMDGFAGIGTLVLGGALVLLAVFAPYALFRLIPAVSSQVAGAFEGVTRRPTAAVPQPHPVSTTYARVAQLRSAGARNGAAGGGGTWLGSTGARATAGAAAGPGATTAAAAAAAQAARTADPAAAARGARARPQRSPAGNGHATASPSSSDGSAR